MALVLKRDGIVLMAAKKEPGHSIRSNQLFLVTQVHSLEVGGVTDHVFRLESVYPQKISVESQMDKDVRKVVVDRLGEEPSEEVHFVLRKEVEAIFELAFIAHLGEYPVRKWLESRPNKPC